MSRASNVDSRNKIFACSTCGKTFDSQQTLDSHKGRDHGVQPESPAGVGYANLFLLNSEYPILT